MRVRSNLPSFGLVFRERLTSLPTDRARVMFALLATYADRDDGDCWPKQATLAADLGWSEPTVRRALDDLRAASLLETRPVLVAGRKTQNAYWLNVSPPPIDGTRTGDSSVGSEPLTDARSDESTDRARERVPQSRTGARSNRGTDQGTNQTPVGLTPDAHEGDDEKTDEQVLKDRVHAITTRYYDEFKAATGVAPPESFVSIQGIVKAAVKEGFNGHELLAAMRELDKRDRPITKQTLWSAALDVRGANPKQPTTREAEYAGNNPTAEDRERARKDREMDAWWEAEIAAGRSPVEQIIGKRG